jgi:hypothetical protein
VFRGPRAYTNAVLWLILCLGTGAASPVVEAQIGRGTAVDDPFTDGARSNGADPLDLAWFSNEVISGVPTVLTVVPDAALTGTALAAENPSVPPNTLVTRAVVGQFTRAPQTLGAIGDTVELSLDFRFANVLSANGENRFRIGLYNTAGSPSGSDGTTATRNDKGYLAQTSYGAVAGNTGILKEAGDGTSRLMEGADIAQLGPETSARINSNAKHRGILTITRTGAKELTLRLQVLNTANAAIIDVTRVDSNPVTYTFDEVVLGMHANQLDYRVDNVRVTTGGPGVGLTPIAIGSRRELFVDTSLLASVSEASLELQTPTAAEMSLNFMERPWEGSWSGQGPTILKDGDVYRMYYYCDPTRGDPPGLPCYAESRDGIAWTRPHLRQVLVNGTWDNNVLLMPDPSFVVLRPFIDDRPGVPRAQKYKAVTGGSYYTGADGATWTGGLYVLVSADGLRWRKYSPKPFLPAQRFSSHDGKSNWPDPVDYDGMNTMFWSESEQLYVCYYRSWFKPATVSTPDDSYAGWYRWVKRTTSPDLKTWTPPVLMDTGGLAPEHWYFHATSPYFRAPQIYVAMPSHYIPTADPDFRNAPEDGHSARSESRFASSRGGIAYDRLFPAQRWITTGLPNTRFFFPNQTEWPLFAGRLSLNPVPTGPKEMSVYLEQPGRIVRYTLRTDGFVALSSARTGQAITRPLKFSGTALQVNFWTSMGGSVRVELQDASGRPLPGFTIADATPLSGDQISQIVTWGGNSRVASLAGEVVRVRFDLQSAKLFSFQFFTPAGSDIEAPNGPRRR